MGNSEKLSQEKRQEIRQKKIKDYISTALKTNVYVTKIEDESTEGVQVIALNGKSGIHLGSGIDKAADILGAKLEMRKLDFVDFPYEYSFTYNGTKIFQLESSPL